MTTSNWRSRAGTTFQIEKRAALGSRGMVVTNHPLGSAAGSEQDRARGNHSMKELLLRWTPGRHDHIAGSGVTKGAVVLGPFEPDHISDERHQCATGISVGGIYRFTCKIVLIRQPKEDPYHSRREEVRSPPF